VHRDVKPENVFLATDSFGRLQPKLLDFGIAKMDQQEGRVTQDTVLGSPEYMSPEQARGESNIDARTDVWSTCVMLYEMTTGKVPFARHNYNALRQSILEDDPVPTWELGGGDEALWQVIERGLAKDRDERWAGMTELGEALALWLYEHGVKEDVSGNSIRALWLDGALGGEAPPRSLPTSRPPRLKAREPSFRQRLSKHAAMAGLLALGALAGMDIARLSKGPETEVAPSPTIASSHEDQDVSDRGQSVAAQPIPRGSAEATGTEGGERMPAQKTDEASTRTVDASTPTPASEPEPLPAPARPPPARGRSTSDSRRSIDDFGF
jgi:serine/threonine-protein kinase